MNFVDILIILMFIAALLRGLEEGFANQLFSTAGFFGGLLLGASIEPHIIGLAHTPVWRLAITLLATLGTALLFLFIGELIGIAIKRKLHALNLLNRVDNGLGAILAGIALLAIVWLSSTVVAGLPYPNMQGQVRGSVIVQYLNNHLPPAPNLIADIGHLIAPNGFPNVFIGVEPAPSPTKLPTPADLALAVQKDRASVVKIEGQGCGGVVFGSGFVVGNNFVATNAHVVAGITNPLVIDQRGMHHATTVWFDPNLDFAVLRTNGLDDAALQFNSTIASHDTPGGVLGYPGGGDFQADSAAVLDEFPAVGRNIYNQGKTTRDIYSVQANVIPGNSGGPLVDESGQVIGVIFATSTTYNDVGYALTLPPVLHEIGEAKASNQPVSTGGCAE